MQTTRNNDKTEIEIDLDTFNENYFTFSGGVKKSRNEPFNYHTETLDNGLQLFFIEDSTASCSAAAMNVRVGYQDDPDNVPGLAHFCEHALFLGSQKYPQEDFYSQYLNHHGGDQNAFTANNHTCFHFSVEQCAFAQALDIFSGFFISPCFNLESLKHEVNAVDSEHKKNIKDDRWRQETALRLSLNQKHKLSRFGTGDYSTLLGNQTGHQLRETLLEFYQTHYSSHKMTLFIYHNDFKSIFPTVKNIFNQVSRRSARSSPRKLNDSSLSTEPLFVWESKDETENNISYTGITCTVYEKNGVSDSVTLVWNVLNYNSELSTKSGFSYALKLFQHICHSKTTGSLFDILDKQSLIKNCTFVEFYEVEKESLIGLNLQLNRTSECERETDITKIIAIVSVYFERLYQILQGVDVDDDVNVNDECMELKQLRENHRELVRLDRLGFIDLKIPSGLEFIKRLVTCHQTTQINLTELLSYNMNHLYFNTCCQQLTELIKPLTTDQIVCLSTVDPTTATETSTSLYNDQAPVQTKVWPQTERYYQMGYYQTIIKTACLEIIKRELRENAKAMSEMVFSTPRNEYLPKIIRFPEMLNIIPNDCEIELLQTNEKAGLSMALASASELTPTPLYRESFECYYDGCNPHNNLSGLTQFNFSSQLLVTGGAGTNPALIVSLYLRYLERHYQDSLQAINLVNKIDYSCARGQLVVNISGLENEVYYKAFEMLFSYHQPKFNFNQRFLRRVISNELEILEDLQQGSPLELLKDSMFQKILPNSYVAFDGNKKILKRLMVLDLTQLQTEIKHTLDRVFDSSNIKAVYIGNITRETAQTHAIFVQTKLDEIRDSVCFMGEQDLVVSSTQAQVQSYEIDHSRPIVHISVNLNRDETNSVFNYCLYLDTFEHGVTCFEYLSRNTACATILHTTLQHLYFDSLRTKQQLGYLVNCHLAPLNRELYRRQLYLIFVVQSPVAETNELVSATNEFLIWAREHLKRMPLPVFFQMKHSIAHRLRDRDKNIDMRLARLTHHLTSTRVTPPDWDRQLQAAEALEQLTHSQFLEYFETRLDLNQKTIIVGLNKGERPVAVTP